VVFPANLDEDERCVLRSRSDHKLHGTGRPGPRRVSCCSSSCSCVAGWAVACCAPPPPRTCRSWSRCTNCPGSLAPCSRPSSLAHFEGPGGRTHRPARIRRRPDAAPGFETM